MSRTPCRNLPCDRMEKVHRVWNQRTRVRILGSFIYKLCDPGNCQLLSPVEQGFAGTTSCSLGRADDRVFMEAPSSPSTISVSARGQQPNPIWCQALRLKVLGVAGIHVPLSITHRWGPQTLPGKGNPKRLGFGH